MLEFSRRHPIRTLATIVNICATVHALGCDRRAVPQTTPQARSASLYAKLPTRFEENRGQTDSRVQFLAHGAGYSVFLTSTDAVLKLHDDSAKLPVAFPARKYSFVRMRLEGANPSARASGVDELPGKSNYFIGSDRARWHSNVATFAGVAFRDIYPGVSLKYRGVAGHLEYDFTIAPGIDPRRIRIAIDGATTLAIDSLGDLVIETAGGNLVQKAPVIYQIVDGARRIVAGGYTMRDSHTVGFAIGAYDRDVPLVIDPLLSYASYLGGSLIDFGTAIAVDAAGDAIVTGYTDSADFPIAENAFQPTLFENAGGADDVFISKINPDGSALIYSTYAAGATRTRAPRSRSTARVTPTSRAIRCRPIIR